jgi:hypothetical protein
MSLNHNLRTVDYAVLTLRHLSQSYINLSIKMQLSTVETPLYIVSSSTVVKGRDWRGSRNTPPAASNGFHFHRARGQKMGERT